jgi:hypothetical protein
MSLARQSDDEVGKSRLEHEGAEDRKVSDTTVR